MESLKGFGQYSTDRLRKAVQLIKDRINPLKDISDIYITDEEMKDQLHIELTTEDVVNIKEVWIGGRPATAFINIASSQN
jgi:hypothetical protein